ncbi:class II fructose-bisphosphatase [Clostridium botulinum]|uniref:Fructose-1,6-bisphosphatase n=1 Tax=Clostridium botulinum TaxID=1491 RepID=A0A9Q1UZA3_CLOBO|nr:class II fructose-bisphosphatase [Clostridium botulinum]AEB75518.1 fructose-1,6-bisphosphatase, class II [Clostridium botulinum BKT015925]KEH99610.1 fructose 1,6-bisphosphatase [Clostridium botulinum D str. 16868]KEI04346.1 fructose 1,6-bisphosphatase [Clostridium botulinum C/D str. Sp77]KLU74764.1 fructose 1,6-bisphosphatase [Clostridium botulinum V891]KOA73786.1 fructose 1,6-bisphosphatase [Clostridium botulinum]
MKNLDVSMGLVRVTEAAALNGAKLMGRGDKNAADQAAVDGMEKAFNMMPIRGKVVIGEGEMDEAPMLYIGQSVGVGEEKMPEMDIAVDPIDGTVLIAKGLPNSIAVVAMGPKGSLLHAPDMYMQKIAVGPGARGSIDINKSPRENIINVAKALNKDIEDLTVIVQERERHNYIVEQAREVGARVKLFAEGDVAAILACGFENTGIDLMIGTGGAPEGVIAAAAIKCMGGEIQAKLEPHTDEERERCKLMGIEDIEKVLTMDDLVMSDDVYFAATALTDSDLLKGVIFSKGDVATTHSVVMRSKTRTIRFVEAVHCAEKSCLL